MYYITLKNGNQRCGHIGEVGMLPLSRVDEVTELQVDGDELSKVKRVFPNLPLMPVDRSVVRFYGDYARSIVLACFSDTV